MKMNYVMATQIQNKTFKHWYEAAQYAINNKLWGSVDVVLSNGEYIVVEKAGK